MVHRNGLVRAAACAALACAGLISTETRVSASDDGLSLRPLLLDAATAPATAPDSQPAAPAAAPATPSAPLMFLLEQAGIGKPIEDAGFKLSGFVEGGYTASFQHPPGNVIVGRFQDSKHERLVLDQADFSIDRSVDYGAAAKNHTFDIGGHLDFVYGWDTGAFHSTGIYDNTATYGITEKPYYRSRTSPENQADFEQAYLDFALPIGTGMRIRAGKFVTLLGWEYINPTGNALYSHSYLFTYAIPLTQTGIIGEYKLSDDFVVDAGVTRGWSQSIRDNNGAADFLGNVTWTPQESDFLKKCKVVVGLSEGPQATHDNHDYWTVVDLQASYQATGDGVAPGSLAFAINGDYGDAPHAIGLTSAQWYGAAGYVTYIANTMISLNGRVEWYDDNNGFTLGTGSKLNVYEATFGAAITPFPDNQIASNLVIRPEIRGDYASKDFFNAGTKKYQVTFGIDAFFKF